MDNFSKDMNIIYPYENIQHLFFLILFNWTRIYTKLIHCKDEKVILKFRRQYKISQRMKLKIYLHIEGTIYQKQMVERTFNIRTKLKSYVTS